MTEPNIQYNIPSSVPIASPPTYLLLIDSRVANYQDIINAKQPGVHHIVFDVSAHRTYAKILFKSVEDKIAELGVSAFTSIGLVQHNEASPIYEMFGPLANHIKPIVTSVSSADPDLQSWNSISIFITMLHLTYGIQYFDMMACALYSNPDWKHIIDQLTVKTGVTVRASTDDTGAAALGGDWFLESHTGVNLKEYYFTSSIDSYNGLLVVNSNTADSSINTTKKLLLIDHLIPEIGVIINSTNSDTYCLVFNSSNDTYDTILSKLRFLSGSNRYILDNFIYDTSGSGFGSGSGSGFVSAPDTSPVLSPSILQAENNWPFYPESTAISVQKPVFFQRAKAGETMTTIPYGSTTNEPTTVVSTYIPRDKVRITDLGEIYEIAKTAGEVPSSDTERIHFDCVGILQHAALTNIGYKLTNMIPGQPAIIQNIQTLDANLSSWASLGSFFETLKSSYHMTTLDLMACALYANHDWKYIIDNLAVQQNITIRASIDNTGSTYDGGNWILETQDINLTDVYFTDEIYKWSYILPSSVTALRFDGVNDGIDAGIPAWSNTTQFKQTLTIECWFKTTDTSNQKSAGGLISQWGTYNSTTSPNIGWVTRYKLHMLANGRLDIWLETVGGWGQAITPLSYNDALWHHIAVSYNSSNGAIAMYIDGVLVNSVTHTYPGVLKDFGLWNAPIVIGSDYGGLYQNQTDRQFRGLLSDIRVWNVVRSASEISANYRQRLIGTETGLVGYWKLNHGNGTGWGSYSTALDSTSTRANGTLLAALFGATPSGSWVVSDISFNSRISTMTLGANNGVYNLADTSFTFIDPSSNSLGDFTYTISPGAVATISNGSATTKTIYATSGAISIPTLTVYEFPEIASLSSWQIDISFTVTGGSGTYRAILGDMYNSVNARGWGLWVSSSNRIHWSWTGTTAEPATISVNLNTAYVLTASQSSGTITLTLRTVSTGATQTGSFSNGENVLGKGPVTIGGWQNITGEVFPGTISYVNVSVPTNQRLVTLASSTGGTPATVTATQTSFLDFATGTKTASLTVNSSTPTFSTSFANVTKNYLDSSFALVSPVSNSTGAFSFSSSNTAVATINSATTINALQFNGTTNFIDFASNITELGQASFTIECWVKTSGTSMGLLNCQDSDAFWETGEKSLYIDANGLPAFVGWGNNFIYSTSAVNDNTWHHIAVAWAYTSGINGTGAIYIDGINRTSTNYSTYAAYTAGYNNTGTFVFGKPNNSESVNFFNGAVCELRIWNVARSATDIFQNYRRMLVGNESGLVAYNQFNQGTAGGTNTGIITVTNNKTSGGNTGTLSGSFALTGSSSNWVSGVSIRPTNDVNIVGVGSATITATQEAASGYTSQTTTATLTVNMNTPTIGTFTIPAKNFGDASFNLTAPTSNSNGAFSYTSSNAAVATVTSGGTVTVVGAGSATISAVQDACGNFTARTVTGVLVVSPIAPVITLSTITKTYGDLSFNLQPSSTNTDVTGYNGDGLGGGIFTFSSGNANIITIFDTSYVGITGVGSATITMSQTATTNFTSGSGTVMVTINKGTPILSAFTVSSNRTYGSAPFSALTIPTSLSNGAITYSSSDVNVATIDNSGVITLVGSGYVTFVATQASTAFYNLTTKASNTMTVYRQALALTRASPTSSVINKTYGDSYFNVSAINASNGGAITYETDNSSVAGVINSSTGVISVVSVGTATITARREQTAQYTSNPVSWTVDVARATTTLTGLVDLSYNVTSEPFTVSASSASNGAVTYSLQAPSSGVLTIHPTTGLVTLLAPGTAVIVASQAQGSLYLSPASITATITVRSAGNALQGATLTNTSSFNNVDLSGASLAGVSITNTVFSDAKLSNANMTNAVITSANFTGANLSGSTLAGATITGATFTSASLKNADLSGATLTNTVFTGSDLSGARLTGVDASGASFANAKLNNVNMTGANVSNVNFTNTSIKGAIITDISFSPLQKLQLLKNSDNRDIGQIIIPAVSGNTILSAISLTSPLRSIANLDLTSPSTSVAVVIPTTSTSPTAVLPNVSLNVTDNDKFYLPINEGEYFQIEGVKYSTSAGVVRNYATNAVVEVINYGGKSVWLLAGSVVGLVLVTNTLNTASFVVPSNVVITNLTPFMPTTLPTSNSDSPIVYSSNNTYVATIDSSSGLITLTGHSGDVSFTATQVQNATYGPGSKSSNNMAVGVNIDFSLTGLNQSFNLSTLALLDSSSVNLDAADAAAVYYVRLSDINNVFKYQADAFDVNDVISSDVKYYVFHRKWPAELKINPSHAMMNKTESTNMLGFEQGYTSDKSLLKHDFIRYIALRLFNTIHGVDLFRNETDIQENSVYLGETVRHNIDGILSEISTTSNNGTMSYDASGNKYLTNDSSGNTNLCRELMRQVAAGAASRFYNNGANDSSGLKNIPFIENDTIVFKIILQAASGQNILTGVSEIPSRSYTIKLILKNTVTPSVNTNTAVTDSEMYPNSYPYSTSVTTYAPTADSSGVYNVYSPPAPIPFSRFGFNGWYYMNSTAWVSVAPTVRNHVKWVVSANTVSSTVADLRYVRLNLKIYNNVSLPYLMIYTQAGSTRKYAVSSGNGSLTNGGAYSLYINFNSYTRAPAMIGYTNSALVSTIGSGDFANNEVITSIAVETYGNAAAGNVEFTLASIMVGELSTTSGVTTEKEYGFEAAVPTVYP